MHEIISVYGQWWVEWNSNSNSVECDLESEFTTVNRHMFKEFLLCN
jgi:hypothetical protein